MIDQTKQDYHKVIDQCKQLFDAKNHDYGAAWRILRLPSITDQIYIKARRIRSIQDKGVQLVADDLMSEFIGIINYAIMAVIQLRIGVSNAELDTYTSDGLSAEYTQVVTKSYNLLSNKNHDYDQAWRHMRISSITDIILMKLLRLKQIENNDGHTIVSEGVEANYLDIINYAVFCLILDKTAL